MNSDVITLAAAYFSNNQVRIDEIPRVLEAIRTALETSRLTPAVDVEDSVHPDYLVCLEDGAQVKLLKRYLKQKFFMTPEEYREKWNLPEDYPMVPPNYSIQRSELAKEQGLGLKA